MPPRSGARVGQRVWFPVGFWPTRAAHAVIACLLLAGTVQAFDRTLTPEALTEAITLGRSGIEATRTDFHRRYRVLIGEPPLDYVEVVTPFRRIALAAESRVRSGERMFGQREALATLGDSPEQVELRLELTFHPLNSFVGVPLHDVTLRALREDRLVPPRSVERFARFGPRVDGQPLISPTQGVGIASGATQPLLGGTVVAIFDGRLLDPGGSYEISVLDGGTTLARGRIDFSSLR